MDDVCPDGCPRGRAELQSHLLPDGAARPNPKIRMVNVPPTIDNEDARTYEYDLVHCVESSANHHGQLTAHSRTILHHHCTLEVRGASGRFAIQTDMTCVVKGGVVTCK
jgi:hypothetical protein